MFRTRWLFFSDIKGRGKWYSTKKGHPARLTQRRFRFPYNALTEARCPFSRCKDKTGTEMPTSSGREECTIPERREQGDLLYLRHGTMATRYCGLENGGRGKSSSFAR